MTWSVSWTAIHPRTPTGVWFTHVNWQLTEFLWVKQTLENLEAVLRGICSSFTWTFCQFLENIRGFGGCTTGCFRVTFGKLFCSFFRSSGSFWDCIERWELSHYWICPASACAIACAPAPGELSLANRDLLVSATLRIFIFEAESMICIYILL